MNSRPQHLSYRRHRRQAAWQIIIPVIVAALLVIGLAVLVGFATFRGNGDVSRWAAISTIWLVIPAMIGGLLVLVAFIGFAYLVGKAAGFIPPYTFKAQQFAYRVAAGARRVEYIGHKPLTIVPAIGGLMKLVFRKGVGIARRRFAGQR